MNMADVPDVDDTICSTKENNMIKGSPLKVTTLGDLQKRREALLAQRNMIISKRKNIQNQSPVTIKHDINPKFTDPVIEKIISKDSLQTVDSINLELPNFDNDIAQADTVTFSDNHLIFQETLEISNIMEKENHANVVNIDNLQFIEIIENSSLIFKDDSSVMDISNNNLLPNINQVELNEVANFPDNITMDHSISNIIQPSEVIADVTCDKESSRKRKNKANKEPGQWKKNLNKNLRMKGEAYLGYRRDKNIDIKKKVYHDVLRPARSMQPACNSTFCKKSKLRNCDNIDEDKRKELFELFWKTMSWEQRKIYVCCHVTVNDKKVTKNSESKRTKSLAYFFTIENIRLQVCKNMFLNTLGIKDWFVRYWLDKTNSAMPPHSDLSRNVNRSKKKSSAHEYAEEFLHNLPKMPSHYCRSSTSKQYLEPLFQNMAQLYREYSLKCELESVECLSRRVFDNIFLKLNLSLYHPKKDRCDVCCGHEAGNITDVEIALHRERKEKARREKDIDKDLAKKGECHVYTQDVQAVKLAPNLQASAIYYKTKLCVHNFTMYNLSNHEAVCYWFDESNGTLEASVFASCIIDQLQCILNKKLLPVILFSDGCCAQNRNSILSNALLRLSIERQVIITQKYLEKGHTQMECDSVHSAIECKLKGREIYLPSQYANIAKSARTKPMPYECRSIDYTFFTDFSKDLIYKSIRPGKKANDPTVNDLKVLVYKPDGTIWYKLNFDHPLQPLPQRPQKLSLVTPLSELPKLYTAKLPISQRKYKDLQDLKAVLPSYCHPFYNDLPFKV